VLTSSAAEAAIARASGAYERDDLSTADLWKTIATHGRETAEIVRAIAQDLGVEPRLVDLLALAARWHDAGKAHDTFQSAVRKTAREAGPAIARRRDLAKAPSWERPAYPERPGFRHELASVLALYEVARRSESGASVVLGDARETLEALGLDSPTATNTEPVDESPLTREIAALKPKELDLVAWLVATHHGKLRLSWTSTPLDQAHGSAAIAGVCDGDVIPSFELPAEGGQRVAVPSVALSLALAEMGLGQRYGASWTERASALVERYGPTTLAWLEALLRAADWRASQLTTEDCL
jgi:CRISPR-associated endonuclease/helicase Cas3